ncbi:MAG: hypothetical protein A2096_11970 [Spirochaetes bacterium GWF1_41_5]|nr:MAG: hypothetical protein A2096_11970 [Spirochaetes bacterium GWF1_41_5]
MVFTTIKGLKIMPFFKQIGQFPQEMPLLKTGNLQEEIYICIFILIHIVNFIQYLINIIYCLYG